MTTLPITLAILTLAWALTPNLQPLPRLRILLTLTTLTLGATAATALWSLQ